MPSFRGIQNVLNRINTIEAKFKPRPSTANTFKAGQIPFDMNLKMAMGAQNASPAGLTQGPASLNALLNKMGANTRTAYNTDSGKKLAETAKQWAGKSFKPGQTARCADFVSTMVKNSGTAPPNFKHEINCYELQKQGKKVKSSKDLKPGDVVFFDYTYLPTTYTHTGIYIGDGKFVHRPTANAPVKIDNLEKGYWARKYNSGRRLNA